MQRPKTGFKQKNDDDLIKTNINNIEKYTELLYEEKYEQKVKGARSILVLIADPGNLVRLITEYESQLDVLSRTLKEEHKKNIELLLHLLCFFYNFSFYEEFHQILFYHSIGETCLNIIEFQYAKYVIRKNEITNKANSRDISPKEYQKEIDKFLFLVRKQDRILRLAFTILMHLAEDPKVELKMVKRDIVGFLVKNLDRNNVNLIIILLLFLKKLSIFGENKESMIRNNILNEYMKLFEINNNIVLMITLQNIFNLSFDHKFRLMIIEKENFFLKIADCFKRKEFRGLVLRILYNLSLEEKSKPFFYNTDCLFILYELLYHFPEPIIGIELAALTLNLTTNSKNAQKIASCGVKSLLDRAFSKNDFHLIKILKNILKYSEDESVNKIFENFVDEHFIKILKSKTESIEFLIEIIEILSNIDTNWDQKIEKHGLISLIEAFLSDEKTHDELLLPIVLFLGNISSNKKCSSLIAKSKILSLLFNTLEKKVDASLIFAIIFVLYQLIQWEETGKIILSMDELIYTVLKCLKSENEKIILISLNFLEVVLLYDNKWSEKIKRKKFKINNKEFTQYFKHLQTNAIGLIKKKSFKNKKTSEFTLNDEDDEDCDGEEMYNDYEEN